MILQKQQNVIKNDIYNNIIIALIYGEDLEKIIKIQSNVRGMEMREKIKLKSKKRKLNNQKLNKTNEDNTKTTDFIYDKKISKEINEDDLEKYEKIIVNKKYIFINKIYYSPKKMMKKKIRRKKKIKKLKMKNLMILMKN